MIPELPQPPLPDWLADDSVGQGELPINALLKDSVYYPSCRFDGRPVRYLGGNFHSFVYVDYGVEQAQLEEELDEFHGYRLRCHRTVSEHELVPRGWTPIPPRSSDGDPKWPLECGWIRTPFAVWAVFERSQDFGPDHGPERFSLLYIGGDGVATFQALYHGNHAAPAVVAVIQPGHAFGGNWTYFTDPDQIFGRSVLENPYGVPRYLVYGGGGPPRGYARPCWPQYSREVRMLMPVLRLWEKPAP